MLFDGLFCGTLLLAVCALDDGDGGYVRVEHDEGFIWCVLWHFLTGLCDNNEKNGMGSLGKKDSHYRSPTDKIHNSS